MLPSVSPVITMNIFGMVVTISSINQQYKTVAMIGGIAFQNIMACQVFRLLRQGILYEDPQECSMDLSLSQFCLDRFLSPEEF